MPDISMCKGDGCELKDTCYRYLVKPSKFQSYFDPPKKGKECVSYWEVEPSPFKDIKEEAKWWDEG